MRRRRFKRGITGIEAAIVMIAFVIVAAALAFVTLNMGMFTTQRTREVIHRGLGEASSALEVDGSITALTDSDSEVYVVSIPIKLAPGREVVDLRNEKVTISLKLPDVFFEDIHKGVKHLDDLGLSDTNTSAIVSAIWATAPTAPEAYIVFIKDNVKDTVLEFGEKAIILIHLGSNTLDAYNEVKVEVRPPEGAPLTVARTMPAILPPETAVDLG